MSLLHKLTRSTHKAAKRVGRGGGSGKGSHTAGRGMKGQRSRTGGSLPVWFEGGQLPLIKRLPMLRGKGRFNVVRPTAEITLSELNKLSAKEISLDTLKLERMIDPRFAKVKIVLSGQIDRAVVIKPSVKVTAGARKAIEKAGGLVESAG